MKTAGDILKKKGRNMIWVGADTTIHQALNVMVENKIGAVLVKEDDAIIGIWTERDLMRNVISRGFDPLTAKIKDYMVTGLHSVSHTDSIFILLDKFLELRLRHLLVEKNREYIGMLSRGDVIKAILIEKILEFKELRTVMMSESPDRWRWDRP
ncbi:MAG: CBS domain-containing protein [Desulfobacterales bacterium]|nr:MAG: CBS domain-containing protein [Desulfobacterales bacterium]